MPLEYTWGGFRAMDAALADLADFDLYPLAPRLEQIIVEQNRVGVLGGKDGNDRNAPQLKYRSGFGVKTSRRRVPDFGTTLSDSTGFGPFATGLNDNLTTRQYQELTGPRLAPRKEDSRVIKNLHTLVGYDPATRTWEVLGAWDSVVSARGYHFLEAHFDGVGHLPQYDLRPIRPWAQEMILNTIRAFVKEEFLSKF